MIETEIGPGERSRTKVQVILVLGFGALVALIAFAGWSALQRAQRSYKEIGRLQEADRRAQQIVAGIRSDLQLTAIATRDYLLDLNADPAVARGRQIELEKSTTRALRDLEPLVPSKNSAAFQEMDARMKEYWKYQGLIFQWKPEEKARAGVAFLKVNVSRRIAVMDLASEIEALASDSYRRRREETSREQSNLPYYVAQIVGAALIAGIVVASLGTFQIFQLEGIALENHRKVLRAETELRNLSHRLVSAQEEERRSLSRELHDQVGQLLTALRIGIGNIEQALRPCPKPVVSHIEQTKKLAEQALNSVRDLSMGLRPAMLDDLGLGPALEWQARQHARLCGVPVSVKLVGDLSQLSDLRRTCVYRIVQEALNNVAKHAEAREVTVDVMLCEGVVSVMVRDDGKGFDATGATRGLGLVGIKERVRELGGEATVQSSPGKGLTLLAVIRTEIPVTGDSLSRAKQSQYSAASDRVVF